MPSFARPACPELAPWVQQLWASTSDGNVVEVPQLEHVLPTGASHVVIRLGETPVTLLDAMKRETPLAVGHCIIGGPRSSFYVKRAAEGGDTVGAQLRPGAAPVLLGVPASELAEQHRSLDETWGSAAHRVREQLSNLEVRRSLVAHAPFDHVWACLRARVDVFESALLDQLRRNRLHTHGDWLRCVLTGLEAGAPLSQLVSHSDISHRAFVTRFRSLVGLPPKVYSRLRRFQRVVNTLGNTPLADKSVSLAQVAVDLGFADQAHLTREFRTFAGLSPAAYRRFAPVSVNHVRLPATGRS
jgi:AraC-like DNA-binding protein